MSNRIGPAGGNNSAVPGVTASEPAAPAPRAKRRAATTDEDRTEATPPSAASRAGSANNPEGHHAALPKAAAGATLGAFRFADSAIARASALAIESPVLELPYETISQATEAVCAEWAQLGPEFQSLKSKFDMSYPIFIVSGGQWTDYAQSADAFRKALDLVKSHQPKAPAGLETALETAFLRVYVEFLASLTFNLKSKIKSAGDPVLRGDVSAMQYFEKAARAAGANTTDPHNVSLAEAAAQIAPRQPNLAGRIEEGRKDLITLADLARDTAKAVSKRS